MRTQLSLAAASLGGLLYLSTDTPKSIPVSSITCSSSSVYSKNEPPSAEHLQQNVDAAQKETSSGVENVESGELERKTTPSKDVPIDTELSHGAVPAAILNDRSADKKSSPSPKSSYFVSKRSAIQTITDTRAATTSESYCSSISSAVSLDMPSFCKALEPAQKPASVAPASPSSPPTPSEITNGTVSDTGISGVAPLDTHFSKAAKPHSIASEAPSLFAFSRVTNGAACDTGVSIETPLDTPSYKTESPSPRASSAVTNGAACDTGVPETPLDTPSYKTESPSPRASSAVTSSVALLDTISYKAAEPTLKSQTVAPPSPLPIASDPARNGADVMSSIVPIEMPSYKVASPSPRASSAVTPSIDLLNTRSYKAAKPTPKSQTVAPSSLLQLASAQARNGAASDKVMSSVVSSYKVHSPSPPASAAVINRNVTDTGMSSIAPLHPPPSTDVKLNSKPQRVATASNKTGAKKTISNAGVAGTCGVSPGFPTMSNAKATQPPAKAPPENRVKATVSDVAMARMARGSNLEPNSTKTSYFVSMWSSGTTVSNCEAAETNCTYLSNMSRGSRDVVLPENTPSYQTPVPAPADPQTYIPMLSEPQSFALESPLPSSSTTVKNGAVSNTGTAGVVGSLSTWSGLTPKSSYFVVSKWSSGETLKDSGSRKSSGSYLSSILQMTKDAEQALTASEVQLERLEYKVARKIQKSCFLQAVQYHVGKHRLSYIVASVMVIFCVAYGRLVVTNQSNLLPASMQSIMTFVGTVFNNSLTALKAAAQTAMRSWMPSSFTDAICPNKGKQKVNLTWTNRPV